MSRCGGPSLLGLCDSVGVVMGRIAAFYYYFSLVLNIIYIVIVHKRNCFVLRRSLRRHNNTGRFSHVRPSIEINTVQSKVYFKLNCALFTQVR